MYEVYAILFKPDLLCGYDLDRARRIFDAQRQTLWEDVKRSIITLVPVGMPTDWCSMIVITTKKNGKPQRTLDYQHLNSQCKWETHHTRSSFQLVRQVSPKQNKTVLVAVYGYHSIRLHKESKPLTTFITEWARFMYLRMAQGYLASGDAYTRRYDAIIKDIPHKVKIIDNTLLYDSKIDGCLLSHLRFTASLHCVKMDTTGTSSSFARI